MEEFRHAVLCFTDDNILNIYLDEYDVINSFSKAFS
jgi:hypothetical protein